MRHGIGVAVVIALVLTTACDAARSAVSSVGDLVAVQQAVVKATGHTAVKANLTNDRFLGVSMTNSPFAGLPDDARRAKAQAIAQVAYDAYPPRVSLASVSVVFVKYKVSFFIFTFTDATDVFTFKPADLTPQPST
jgi:hypothetical protein